MKIGIITYDTRIDNKSVNEIIKLNEKYAKINNYQFIFEHSNLDNKYKELNDLNIKNENFFKLKLFYHKFQLIEKYLNGFDYIVYIDTDACFCNPTFKIENLIDNKHDFFISQDGGLFATTVWQLHSSMAIQKYLQENKLTYIKNPEIDLEKLLIFNDPVLKCLKWITTNFNGLNCGFMIFKNSNMVNNFLNDYKKYYPMFEECSYDQGCVGSLLRTKKYKNMVKILPLTTQGNPFFMHPDFIYNEDKNFVCHYYGHSSETENILNHLNSIKNNKWWSKFN